MEGVTDKPGITLVCCGLVGTLVADDGLIERSFAEAIATQGVVVGTSAYARRMAQVHQARGQTPAAVLAGLFPENEARALAAHMAFDRALADAIGRAVIRPVPGAREALEEVRAAGARICVISSLPRRVLRTVLEALDVIPGWRGLVDVTLSAEDMPGGFPAPDPVLGAMDRVGVGDARAVAIVHATGAGVEGGRRAGASIVVGVLTGAHAAPRLRAAGATHVIASVADFPDVLKASGLEPTVPPPAAAERGGHGQTRFAKRTPMARNEAGISVPAQVPSERRSPGP